MKNAERLAATAANDAKRLLAALAEVDHRREAQAQVEAEVQEKERRIEEEQAVQLQSQPPSSSQRRRPAPSREIGRAAHVA